MEQRRIVTLALAILLCSVSLSFKCDGGGPPDNSPFRAAAKAAGDFAETIKAMIEIKRRLGQQNSITRAEELTLTNELLRVNSADKVFTQTLNGLRTMPDAATKAVLAQQFDTLSTSVKSLNVNGIGPIQNSSAKANFQGPQQTLAASLKTLAASLKKIASALR